MWERDAKGMQITLARHDEILKSVIEGHGGFVFKMVGEGLPATILAAGYRPLPVAAPLRHP
jgi:hypothetical protein